MRFLAAVFVVFLLVFSSGCQKNASKISEPARSHYVQRSNADTVIVFVHGLFGDASSSWKNSTTGAYWPELIKMDSSFKDADVYVYAYSSPYLAAASSIDEVVEQMKLALDSDEIFTKHKHVIFLCHSMGGVVTRKLLTRYQSLGTQVSLIYFFGTPTTGDGIARLVKVFSSNPQVADLDSSEAESYVDVLQRDWRAANFSIRSRCAYEEKKIYGIRILAPVSASMLCEGPILPIDKNHVDMVKPSDRGDPSYISFRQAFLEIKASGFSDAQNINRKQTEVTLVTRPVIVNCGKSIDSSLEISLPDSLQAGTRLVDAIVSLQQLTNIKQHKIQLVGRSETGAVVRYELSGLDLSEGTCLTNGAATIVVAFVLAKPVPLSNANTIQQITTGNGSPAISNIFGNVLIVRNKSATSPSSHTPCTNPGQLPLATAPQFQGVLLNQETRGSLSPAIASVNGSILICDN